MAYIKVNRELINSPIYYDDKLFSFYVRLIMLCRVKPIIQKRVEVARGQCLTTIRELAAVLNLKNTNTLKLLNTLEREQLITITKCPRGSIITVNNFDCLGEQTENRKQQKSCSREQNANKTEGSTLFYNNKKNVKNGVPRACEESEIANENPETAVITDEAFGENEACEAPVIDGKNRENTKRFDGKIIVTRESLVEKYGEENVFEYECRFERWKNRQAKPVSIDCYDAIERWMRDDCVKKPNASEAAFDTNEIMQRIIKSYNR